MRFTSSFRGLSFQDNFFTTARHKILNEWLFHDSFFYRTLIDDKKKWETWMNRTKRYKSNFYEQVHNKRREKFALCCFIKISTWKMCSEHKTNLQMYIIWQQKKKKFSFIIFVGAIFIFNSHIHLSFGCSLWCLWKLCA